MRVCSCPGRKGGAGCGMRAGNRSGTQLPRLGCPRNSEAWPPSPARHRRDKGGEPASSRLSCWRWPMKRSCPPSREATAHSDSASAARAASRFRPHNRYTVCRASGPLQALASTPCLNSVPQLIGSAAGPRLRRRGTAAAPPSPPPAGTGSMSRLPACSVAAGPANR